MCGICGFTGPGNLELLKKMTRLLVHRGPDDEGYYTYDGINLGMRRLAIVDVEGGPQPQTNEDKTIWIIFNGEVYNFIELREDLLQKGHRFSTHHSDTEVIVHLYEDYGLEFVKKINGMFAIAIWDLRKKALILLRDRLGVKPLFYTSLNGKLIFSSEIKSILNHPDVKRTPNFRSLHYYLSLKHIPSPYTAFEGIHSLRPAHYLIFKDSQLTFKKYWDIKFKSTFTNEEEVIEQMFSILKDAVRVRLRTDVPFGLYLSGGVDSSCIVSLASQMCGVKLKTFSLGYKDAFANKEEDIKSARAMSQLYGTEHYEYYTDAEELKKEVHNIISSFDQPFGGVISTYFLTKLISRHVKVALSGDGADEQFGSYLSHRLASCYGDYVEYKKFGEAKGNLVLFKGNLEFIKTIFQGAEKVYKWRARILPFSDIDSKKVFSKETQDATGSESMEGFLRESFDISSPDLLNKLLEAELKTFFPDQVLAFMDFLSMSHSVEIRSPFIDYRFVELVAQIDEKLKIKDGTVKFILKKFIQSKRILPRDIIARPKEGFVMPVYRWLDSSLKNWAKEIISPASLKGLKIFNAPYIEDMVNAHYEGKIKSHAEIWNIIMLVLWYRRYFS